MTGHLRNGQNMRVGVIGDKLSLKWQRFLLFLYADIYASDISFSIFIYQLENTNNCITLLKEGWSLGAQEDHAALYRSRKLTKQQINCQSTNYLSFHKSCYL